MLVDCHCHLTFPQFDSDREQVIDEAAGKGVIIVNSSVGVDEIAKAAGISRKFDNVFWTLGLTASTLEERQVEETIRLARKHRRGIVGLGEVGLDYHWVKDEAGQGMEREYFRRFIELSVELSLPLVVHSRNAEEDCIKMLDEYGKCALLHCFSGSVEQALYAAESGHLISIPTNVTYVKSRQRLADKLPLGSIVLETDAPYLAPVPKSRNVPVNVAESCAKIAELKKTSAEDVAAQTTENAKRFFNI
ncbi:MAG: TatD family hydrolase [Candidatus Altiarchaeota archaeon]